MRGSKHARSICAARVTGDLCCESTGHLTDREIQVLIEMAGGCTNAQIAGRLRVSVATIAHHIERMMRKANADCRAELVARAFVAGILTSDAWPPAPSGSGCLGLVDARS